MQYRFSVFTPTYNRAHTLERVYESLKSQTYKDFEWLVIDDGSTDGTDELMARLCEESPFHINYACQKHAGKHIAQNLAIDLAQGELFVPLDSDDMALPDMLEIFASAWESIPPEERDGFSGVEGLCIDQNGNIMSDRYPSDEMISNDLEMHFIHKPKGEKCGLIRTDIMREHKNPEIEGTFISEGTIWFKIAEKYKKLYFNRPVQRIFVSTDSVSKRSDKDFNYKSYIYSAKVYINDYFGWFWKYDKKDAVKRCLGLSRKCVCNGVPVVFGKDAVIKEIKPFTAKCFVFIGSFYKPVYAVKKLLKRI